MAEKGAKRRGQIIICLAIVTTLCAALLAFVVVPYWADIWAFKREKLSPHDAELLEINPDYIGWLRIEDTNVDYPVVRGSDNEKYLTTSFAGEENILGALFMDYRCVGDIEDIPHLIIYGHEVTEPNGSQHLFGGLIEFLDEQYLAQNPYIMFMKNYSLYVYEIFSARMTDIYDPAYRVGFDEPGSFDDFAIRCGAPSDATQIITLSTCYGTGNDIRVIVQGAYLTTVPVTQEYGENGWRIIDATE